MIQNKQYLRDQWNSVLQELHEDTHVNPLNLPQSTGSLVTCLVQFWRAFLKTPEKPFFKLRSAYIVKLVFSYVVKGIKIKITAKFRDTEHLRFEDTKRIMSPEKFRNFRETGPWTPSPVTQRRRCVTGEGVQNWTSHLL